MHKRAKALISAIGVAFLAFAFSITSATAQEVDVSTLNAVEKERIELALKDEFSEVLSRAIRSDRIRPGKINSVTLDPSTNRVNIDLSSDVLPYPRGTYPVDVTEVTHEMLLIADSLFHGSIKFGGVILTFDGKPLEFYYPNLPGRSTYSPLITDIVINAGHGWYWRATDDTWRFQRGLHNGVLEDLITPGYASVLADLLAARSLRGTQFVRSLATTIHPDGNRPWWEMAAYYHLMILLPNSPHVWDAPTNNANYIYSKDIMARPLFANEIGSDLLVSIHTNGFLEDPSVRGTRIYVAPNSPSFVQDSQLANHILCYMEETIRSQDGYEDFPVSSSYHTSNHAENTLATMPSVIVETAFHTNPDDAAALLDPVFQEASMKGVEKGYRLHNEEKPCTHLALLEVTDGSAPHGGNAIIYATFEGYPQYPLMLELDVVECAPGWSCSGGFAVWEEEDPNWPNDIAWQSLCDSQPEDDPATHTMRARLIDVDNVTTDWEQYTITCGVPAPALFEQQSMPEIRQVGTIEREVN